MIRWTPYAFVRIVFFFIMGISLAIVFPTAVDQWVATFFFLVLLLSYGVIVVVRWRMKVLADNIKLFAGVTGLSAILVAGYLNVLLNTESRRPDHLVNFDSAIDFSEVVISGIPEEKSNSWKMEAEVQTIKSADTWTSCTGKLMLYFSKKDFPAPFHYGDVLVLRGHPQPIEGPSNPEEFNYKRFMAFKNIYHQQFVRSRDVYHTGFKPKSLLTHFALTLREWADKTIKENVSGDREESLASALVLGVTDGIDNEILSAYKATGTMHVLAVSGLHVAILYGLVLFILKPLNRLKFGPWILAIISLAVLWIYALITGLSPSVLRAVTMFSFIALAKPMGHRTNIYNTLAASAFCILMYDPFLLMSVGFQLSYLAVLAIVYIQPRLYQLWEPGNRVMDEIWKVSCVSVAAQVGTLPLGLLYFHQFPNYFLISNLFVIPGSFVVLIIGLLILASAIVPPVASFLGLLLEWTIKAINFIVFGIEKFPFALTDNIYITPFQCWLLVGIFVAVLVVMETRKFKAVYAVAFLGIAFAVTQWYHFQENIRIKRLMVYDVRGHSAIDMIDQGRAYFMADSILKDDLNKVSFHITPNRVKAGVRNVFLSVEKFQRQFPGCSLTVWNGQSFLQIYDREFSLPQGLVVDVTIISNDAVKDLQALEGQVHTSQFVLDSSNSKTVAQQLLSQKSLGSPSVYSVLHQGAFELNI